MKARKLFAFRTATGYRQAKICAGLMFALQYLSIMPANAQETAKPSPPAQVNICPAGREAHPFVDGLTFCIPRDVEIMIWASDPWKKHKEALIEYLFPSGRLWPKEKENDREFNIIANTQKSRVSVFISQGRCGDSSYAQINGFVDAEIPGLEEYVQIFQKYATDDFTVFVRRDATRRMIGDKISREGRLYCRSNKDDLNNNSYLETTNEDCENNIYIKKSNVCLLQVFKPKNLRYFNQINDYSMNLIEDFLRSQEDSDNE